MQGLYGAFFGIIAGPIGIRLSNENKIRKMKCLWNAFITFVSSSGYNVIYQIIKSGNPIQNTKNLNWCLRWVYYGLFSCTFLG